MHLPTTLLFIAMLLPMSVYCVPIQQGKKGSSVFS
ncbi:hypothetical protein GLYMA_08G173050v4 [Glycine max]|nr:hypothetical protein GLYMA_08G173050v4 [Glycine max]KAH1051705.1 hypothetical protein GYH30_021545 [Glycine max]